MFGATISLNAAKDLPQERSILCCVLVVPHSFGCTSLVVTYDRQGSCLNEVCYQYLSRLPHSL